MNIRRLLLCGALVLLAGCGFQPRRPASLPFQSIYVAAPAGLAEEIKRQLPLATNLTVVDEAPAAGATLQILDSSTDQQLLTVDASGRARENLFLYQVRFTLTGRDGTVYIPPSQLQLRSEFSSSPSQLYANHKEVSLLEAATRRRAAEQIIQRMRALAVKR